jgi:hypothetical protein
MKKNSVIPVLRNRSHRRSVELGLASPPEMAPSPERVLVVGKDVVLAFWTDEEEDLAESVTL